jgi:hypothetical protein
VDPPSTKRETMKAIYTIREYNKKTKKYTEIDSITATNQEEAREVFFQKHKWKPEKHTILFIRLANCK